MKNVKTIRLGIATILIAISFILHKTIGYDTITVILMVASTAISGYPIFKKAFISLKYKIVGIEALVMIAVIGALIIGEYWEAAAVTFLFMLGDYLESKTIEKTRSSISALLKLKPIKARVLLDGAEIEKDPNDVHLGDLVLVKPGEKIAVDGMITDGNAYINESAFTGESIPVYKEIGNSVYSGTVIESGYLIIKTEKVGEDTAFARILEMVEEAQDKKAKTQKFIEKFSKYYTPLIILLAILFYIIKKDIVLSLTLLVIACPGALVISTPVSIVAGIGSAAKRGVLFKGGEIIEKLGKIKALAFDKTGTLTEGKPSVTKIQSFGINKKKVLEIATAGEAYSEHPLAIAIINKAKMENVNPLPTKNTEIIAGKGVYFDYKDEHYIIGNRSLFNSDSIPEEVVSKEEDAGQTAVLLGTKDRILGVISIADTLRKESIDTVSQLKKLKIKTMMLTGDNQRTAKAIFQKVGMDEYYAELLPEQKVAKLKESQEKYGAIGMVGDGINDAPALATADLGIAIGGIGKDAAMETADIILLSEEIGKLVYAFRISKATVRNMTENIVFALLVAGLLLLGVIYQSVSLSLGMLVHEISVLLVVLNAIRLLYFSKKVFHKRR